MIKLSKYLEKRIPKNFENLFFSNGWEYRNEKFFYRECEKSVWFLGIGSDRIFHSDDIPRKLMGDISVWYKGKLNKKKIIEGRYYPDGYNVRKNFHVERSEKFGKKYNISEASGDIYYHQMYWPIYDSMENIEEIIEDISSQSKICFEKFSQRYPTEES